jgi:lysophospholipase L1-like esterase
MNRIAWGARQWLCAVLAAAAWLVIADPAASQNLAERWVGTWASSAQLADPSQAEPTAGFQDTTLRQYARVSIGGTRTRVRFSNAFGTTPLTLTKAHLALAAGGGAIRPESDKPLTFAGRVSVTVPPGALMVSDPLDFALSALSDVAVTVHLRGAPQEITAHPGSRTTSYLQTGDAVSTVELAAPVRIDHWYFLNGIDVMADGAAAAVVVLGDSITDGRGSTTNGNDRWTDHLARRLQSETRTSGIAVLNQGIGGNRLLRDGLGPNALARLDRDVLAQTGVRFLIVLLGVNDLGTRRAASERGDSAASVEDMIAGYEQVVLRAHTHGIRVYGATVLPFEGFAPYFTPAVEADRQAINTWIRTSGRFDGVIDFDAVLRDPERPSRLRSEADGGDHLHPGPVGYRLMGEAVDLGLFDLHSGGRP